MHPMAKKNSDITSFIIGVCIVAFIVWQVIGYILPDQPAYETAQELLTDVVKRHATINDWNTKKQLSFQKAFQLYREDGSVEIDRNEQHTYSYIPINKRQIHWSQNEKNYVITAFKDSITQTINNALDTTATQEQLYAKLNASEFVINLPHSLQSPNATLDYEGTAKFQGASCHVLRVNFKNSKDVWWMYFAESSLDWIGYWVKTSGHYSLVINEEMEVEKGFTLSRKRKSYRTDSLQNKTYLRASYEYSNYSID